MISGFLGVLLHALFTIVAVNRYIAGVLLRVARGKRFDETIDLFEPTVGVIIPMFNEGVAIKETLQSLLVQEYPHHKVTITVIDDCSTDDSFRIASDFARRTGGRIRVLRNTINMGKRRSINRAVRETECEIIVSVDSDVVVDKQGVRQLVRRFTSPKIAAVGGRVDVRNKHDNWLTRMQVVKYYYAYYFLKNLEWAFRRVMCLSGCLTAYRRSVLLELEPLLEHRAILGVPIKYGEDRFLTRQIVKAGYLTTMTLDAVCSTFVPVTLSGYFSQQLRWRRSNIVDYVGGMSHVWRLNPIIAVHFFSLFALLVAYPALVAKSILAHKFFGLLAYHLVTAFVLGLIYRWKVRKLPASDRVPASSFIPISLVLPVIYALLTPLALFTLDSGSWETRGHDDDEAAPDGIGGESRSVPTAVASEHLSLGEPASVARVEMPAA